MAARARRLDALRALVRGGADLGAIDAGRYGAVTISAVADDEVTQALLELGANAGLVTSRYNGTALLAAAHLGHDGVVRQLIAAGAPLDQVNKLHWTAMMEAVVLGSGGPRHQATLKALSRPMPIQGSPTASAVRRCNSHGRAATRQWRACSGRLARAERCGGQAPTCRPSATRRRVRLWDGIAARPRF